MPTPSLQLTASIANLRRLAIIRLILIFALLTALIYIYLGPAPPLLDTAHLSILAFMSLVNMLTYWRLQQPWPVTDIEYFFQLLVDMGSFTLLLYFSGGASNPFVSYYLVPLTISAAVLPWRFTWVVAGLSLSAYTLLLFFYKPLPFLQPAMDHSQHGNALNAHIVGMWITFALSTGLITYFVVKMANALRQQDISQAANRENDLRDEQILAVATLAAGTAHELGTPLATMTVLVEELQQDYQQQKDLGQDLSLLNTQLTSCKRILQGLVSTAEAHNHGRRQSVVLADYISQLLNHWQVLRPDAHYQFSATKACYQLTLEVDTTLDQAINNLLNNAADAKPDNIEVTVDGNNHELTVMIRDHGEGIDPDVAEQLGKPFISTKGKGLGLGLFLSHATINRYNGSITLHNHPEGGTLATIKLPVNPLQSR
ncbi:ATP-binding protein [Oceanicoccus sagamiensis]|uniref:histidine kinase n=1 Tax=Oceanicoccus sagamiensis TaxID=716816 RepID=A0A1X9N963_9GAMM|nr:ATP-binding protein [Oceanicoccus sagamiensis]ARN74618.1 ATP-binding protein [Oceanicoccus sagamiensis]